MVWRKTWPGYVIWAVYSAFDVSLVVMFSYFSGLFPSENRMAFTAAFTALSLAGVGVIAFMGGKLADYIGGRRTGCGFWVRAGYIILVIFMFSAAAGIRICILKNLQYQISGNVSLYQMAMIGAGPIPQTDILTFVYTSLIRQILMFTGNIPAAAALCQMIFQLLTAFLLYLAIDISMGRIPAFFTGAYVLFMPFYVEQTGVLGTNTLFILMFMAELLLVVLFLQGISQKKYRNGWWNIWYLAVGAGVGFMLYLDAGTIIIFGLVFSAFFLENTTFGYVCRRLFVLFAGVVSLFILMIGQQAGWQSIQMTFQNWIHVYFENVNTIDFFSIYTQYRMIYLLTVITMFLGCIGFMREKKRERTAPWMLLLLLVTVCTPFMGPTMLSGQQVVTLFYAVVTGGGIAAMITPVKKETYENLFENESVQAAGQNEETVNEKTENTESGNTENEMQKAAPVRYVPEGMVLPTGEEDVDEDAAPRMKMPEYREAEPISLNRQGKMAAENTEVENSKPEEQHPAPEEQDFDLPFKPGDDFDV
ncbi:MAG: glycosyltransferase family 39 protein [Butyrivibrio sp.]|nr:glycosyltransferase family 39 protein [Butyrivibrio sp.]